MQKKRIPIVFAVLLLLVIVNFSRLKGIENLRAIQFIYIFVMGGLFTLLIYELVKLFNKKGE
jgi:uncharacterized membrane protein YcaP (DUF421 family)